MGSVTIEIGFSMQPIAWASGQLKFRTEFWQIRDVMKECGGPLTFNLDLLVTLDRDAIHRQPLARHAKIKEQLDKMKCERKIWRKSEPKA